VSFSEYDVDEPLGSAQVISVNFSSTDRGDAQLAMQDRDTDGCWDVTITAQLLDPSESTDVLLPTPESTNVAPTTTTTIPVVEPPPELDGIGMAQIIAGRGTYQATVVTCTFDPISVEAFGAEGTLTVLSGSDDTVIVSWTYASDNVEVRDSDARTLTLGPDSGNFVADGYNQEDPETLIVEVTC
jgi:hypothetical protein